MSKTKEEIKELKEEIASVNEKLQELTPEELEQVTGGNGNPHCGIYVGDGQMIYSS